MLRSIADAARRAVPPGLKPILRNLLVGCGVPLRHQTEDRRILEQIILPELARREELRRLLFIGCEWYTKSYQQRFFRYREYWTLDFDPRKRRYGAPGGHHIVAAAQQTAAHFPAESVDLVVCNGVFGWGLDDRADVEHAFAAFFTCLRPGGLFLLGWNDIPDHRPFPPEECDALRRFALSPFSPLKSARFLTDTEHRHTFDFYVRPPL